MDQITPASDLAKLAAQKQSPGLLGRRGGPQSLIRRALRGFIHFFSYNFILKRQSIRLSHAAGFKLRVRPTVFHPKFFISSEKFAEFIDTLDLTGEPCARIVAPDIEQLELDARAAGIEDEDGAGHAVTGCFRARWCA